MADVESIKSPGSSPSKPKGPDPLVDVAAKPTKFQVSGKEYDPDLLWYIHGKAYDLTDWVRFHPGGQDALLNAQGRDGTALFESYHFFTDRARNLLAKMTPVEVPPEVLKKYVMDTSEANYFILPDGSYDPFWEAIRNRCKKVYEDDPSLTRTSGWGIYLFHMALLLVVQPLIFYYGYLQEWALWSHLSAFAMGIVVWIGGRLGHDAGHYAVCPKKYYSGWFTAICSGFALTNIGYWQLLHTVMHHTYTNMDNDPDLYHYVFFLRDHANYPYRILHRLQIHRIWCYIVWSATTAGLLILEPVAMLVTGSATRGTKTRLHKKRYIFWFFMIIHLFLFPAVYLALPIYLTWDTDESKYTIISTRVGSWIYFMMGSGLCFGIFSQSNHFSARCVEAATKPTSWGVRQIETAANFCINSWFWSIITAGINVQIEHHLFPSVASDKLDKLIPIVQETCKEFNVDYKNYSSFREILASVHEYLDHLAKPLPSDGDVNVFGFHKRKQTSANVASS